MVGKVALYTKAVLGNVGSPDSGHCFNKKTSEVVIGWAGLAAAHPIISKSYIFCRVVPWLCDTIGSND